MGWLGGIGWHWRREITDLGYSISGWIMLITCVGGCGCSPSCGGRRPGDDVVLGGDPGLQFGFGRVGNRRQVGWEMVKLAWVQGAVVAFVGAPAAHEGELAWL